MIKGSDIETGGTGTRLKPMNIYSKIALKEVAVDEGFVEITFVDPETRLVAIKRLWEPKGKFPNEKEVNGVKVKETIQEAKDREMKLNLSNLTRLVELTLGVDARKEMAAPDYDSFVELAITLLKPIYEKPLFNLKVGMDDNGYAVIGKFPSSYIELYKEGVAPSLKFDSYELKTAATTKGPKEKAPNPLGGIFDNVE